MTDKVAIIGIGHVPPRPASPEVSYREMIYEAAVRAYSDAGIDASQIDGFVGCAEDLLEGVSIYDEYTPDQLGAVQKPVHTVTADFLAGLASAEMQLRIGRQRIIVVEGHSKASNIKTLPHIQNYATDPFFFRPFDSHPGAIAGLEMQRYLFESNTSREHCAHVAKKNKRNGLKHASAAYAGDYDLKTVLQSPANFDPITELETAPLADGAYVAVLADEETVHDLGIEKPIWILGTGWCSDSSTLSNRDWSSSTPARLAAEQASGEAGIDDLRDAVDVLEIDDQYAYKELQTLEALGFFEPGEAGRATAEGKTELSGSLAVNPSGGSLAYGHLLDAAGGQRTVDCVRQLRGEAGAQQVEDAVCALAHTWRGVPSTSHAVVLFGSQKEVS